MSKPIRDKVLVDQIKDLLSKHLGTYTFSNGEQRPAIWLRPPQPPDNIKVSGLECIIFRNSVTSLSPPWNGYYTATVQHTVFLVQHDNTKTLYDGMALLSLDPYYTIWANPVEFEQEPSYVYGRFYVLERWKVLDDDE